MASSEAAKAAQKRYYANHRKEMIERVHDYYMSHRDERLAYAAEYYRQHRKAISKRRKDKYHGRS